MGRSDDLVPLLTKDKAPSAGFRQGVIVSWNPDTAENSVAVAGSVFNNLPILNTSEASLLKANDVVGLLTLGSSFAILGRLTIPGTPEAVSSIQSITSRIQAAEDVTQGSRNSTTYGDLTGSGVGPSVTIRVGASGRALVFWSAEIGQTADYMTANTPHVGVQVSGANTIAANDVNALNLNISHPSSAFSGYALTSMWIQMAMMHLFTGLTPGESTFTLKYKHTGETPAQAVNFQAREIAVFAL